MEFLFLMALVVIATIIGIVYSNAQTKKRKQETISELSQKGFAPTIDCNGLLIDKESKKWAVATGLKNEKALIHDFKELVDYKLVENGIEYKSSGGVLRAVVGGALFGAAGAVVGASTSKQKQRITTLYVLITTSNFDRPTEKITLYDNPSSPANTIIYNDIADKANKIIGYLGVIQANT